MGIKIIKVGITINMDDVETENNKVSSEPTVESDYDNRGLNNKTMWYQEYNKDNKWIRIEGQGDDPFLCENIIIRRSSGNDDILNEETTFNHPKYGIGLYKNYIDNLYIQSMKLKQLLNIGYSEGKNNFVKLID